ncbi:hypothetical protein [Actinophytocola glycyrrhizae]|uniref:DUF11 domain-containing protein n=1 Tax=Actinophytocola glycyrrhizae TaxID=2044873 RepID=A0ABV9SC38_9PSEU
MPVRRSLVVLVVAVLVALVAPPVPAVPHAPEWTVAFDGEVTGDVAVAGNAVTRCPPGPGALACRDAETGAANGALNNDHSMVWTDTDDDPRTVTSSSARVDVPAGARIVHATLSWGGVLRAGSTGLCGRTATWPPGTPAAVRVAVGGREGVPVAAAAFTAEPSPPGADRWYSAHADVTDRLADTTGPVDLTVGDVRTGQGRDCAGGWSVTAVWSRADAARHRVTVHTGHERVAGSTAHVLLAPPGLRAAGGTTRLAVAALEGDRAIGGDTLRVNGSQQAGQDGPGNVFVSGADGAREPAHVNNMSVDVTTIELAAGVVRPGDTAVEIEATSGADHYLLYGLALSVPLPGIALHTSVDRPVTHEGEDVTQRSVVTNTGGVPLHDVVVASDLGCRRVVGPLAPGAHAELVCTGPGGRTLAASASATDAAGGTHAATATAATRVIRPALTVRVGTPKPVVLIGKPVTHRVTVTNSGDAPVSSVRLRGLGCDRVVATVLAPAATATADCTAPPALVPVTATAVDELGAPVTARARASYRIVRVGLALEIVVPEHPVAPGGTTTLTIRVRNTGDVAFTNVAVTGEPAACHRFLPRLEPGATAVHTCRVVVTGPATVTLTVTGVPDVSTAVVGPVPVSSTAEVRLAPEVAEAAAAPGTVRPPPAAVPEPEPEHELAQQGPLRSPVTPAVIAVLGVLVMTVSLGGLSTAARRLR